RGALCQRRDLAGTALGTGECNAIDTNTRKNTNLDSDSPRLRLRNRPQCRLPRYDSARTSQPATRSAPQRLKLKEAPAAIDVERGDLREAAEAGRVLP